MRYQLITKLLLRIGITSDVGRELGLDDVEALRANSQSKLTTLEWDMSKAKQADKDALRKLLAKKK